MGGFAGPESATGAAGDLRAARCRLGQAYQRLPPDCAQTSLFGGADSTATLSECEVFYSPDLAALY